MQRGIDIVKAHVENSKKTLIRAGMVVVVLAAIVGGYLYYEAQHPYATTQAPKGEVIADFPKDLLVEKNTTIQDSYSLVYKAGNLSQPVVTYVSNWPMIQNVVQFGSYLRKNGWTITHEADPLAKNTFYYANKDANETNITFVEETGKVKVTISYVKR